MTMRRFIVLEGMDYCGKSTIANELSRYLENKGVEHIRTREPGGSLVAEHIRDLVLSNKASSIDPISELLLFTAARVEHLKETVIPALSSGKTVICERFFGSTFVYQGNKLEDSIVRQAYSNYIRPLNRLYKFSSQLHTIILDIDYTTLVERVLTAKRHQDRLDCTNEEDFKSMRTRYLCLPLSIKHCTKSDFSIVNANKPLSTVISDVIEVAFPDLGGKHDN